MFTNFFLALITWGSPNHLLKVKEFAWAGVLITKKSLRVPTPSSKFAKRHCLEGFRGKQ